MKKIIIILISTIYYNNMMSQPSSCAWLNIGAGAESEKGNNIAKDNNGNIYVSGSFSSPLMTLGNTTLTNYTSSGAPKEDIFIVKYAHDGNIIWAKSFGGANYDICTGIAVDHDGNVLLTGYFASDSISFGNATLINLGGNDVFVVKLDENGNVLWSYGTGSENSDLSNSIAVDNNNNIYIAGSFNFGTIDSTSFNIGTFTIPQHIGDNLFIVKLNPNALVLWAKSTGGIGYNSISGIATDLNNNLFVGGSFENDTIDFGNHILTNNDLYDRDGFIVKYDTDGNSLWAIKGECSKDDYVNAITTDLNGSVYFTGNYSVTGITFGNVNLPDNSLGDYSIYVAKFDSSGIFKWAEESKNGSRGKGISIATDASGNTYLTGEFHSYMISFGIKNAYSIGGGSDIFLIKFNQIGIAQWLSSYGSNGTDKGNSIAIENAGAIYLTGFYNNYYLSFSNCTSTFPELSDDMFTVKLNTITGIEESANTDFTIAPNPTYDHIAINSNTNPISKVILTSAKGDFIKVVNGNNSFNLLIELNSLPSAMYFAEIYGNNGSVKHHKIIKE
jgi:hypothetical protein